VAQVGRGVENADHWRAGACQILRPYFLAAAHHPRRPGDFTVVLEWLAVKEFEEPLTILTGVRSADADLWARELLGVAGMQAEKERESFFSAARTALKAMSDPNVVRSATGTDFDPVEFLRTRSTLYIVSPSEHQEAVAPLISALIESIVNVAYELHRAGALRDRLLLSLDELANIAPLPSLGTIVSQGAGQGVLVSWAVQSHAQLRHRYGKDAAEAIWSATRCKLIFGGLADTEALEQISRMIGDHRVPTRSISVGHGGQRQETRGHEWRPRLTVGDLRGLPPKWGVLVYHHRRPYALRVPVAARRWQFRQALGSVAPPPPAVIVPMPVRPQVVHLDELADIDATSAATAVAESER
jgi:type IV secretory pathway TraG/TraD family ATPase VirD4